MTGAVPQYYTDFGEHAAAPGLPSGWTNRWSSTDLTWSVQSDGAATGGRVLQLVRTSNGRTMASWDVIDADSSRVDIEILSRLRFDSDSTGFNAIRGGVASRTSGSAGTETGYHGALMVTGGTRVNRTGTYNGGSGAIIQDVAESFAADTWYWIRMRVIGTTFRYRRWAGAVGDEPGSWQIDVTNSTVTGAGGAGVFGFAGFSTRSCQWDVFAVGTNGDTAPSAPVPTVSIPALYHAVNRR